MKIQMMLREEIIAKAQEVGATLLEHKSHSDNRIDAQTRVKLYEAHELFNALLDPVRNKNDYKLLFNCWSSHAMFPGAYILEEQTGDIVRRSDPSKTRTIQELFREFCTYTELFGIEIWSKNKFIAEVLEPLEIVNTLQLWVSKVPVVSAQTFEDRTGVNPTQICERLTGNKNELINRLWTYHFTGLVDRILHPGCKLDSMLILISKQKGWSKTRFLEALAESNRSKNYVSVYELNAGDVELCKLIRGKAVINVDECDAAMRGKCAAKTKAFLTNKIDNFRPSYGALPVNQPRCGATFGTSNNLDIIQDLEGDRRFYPVLLEKPIDVDWFEENRVLIYGYYKGLLNSGAKTFPNSEEQLDLTQAIQPQFKVQPLYFERLTEFLNHCKDKNIAFSTTDLLHAAQNILDNQPKYEKAAVENLLVAMHWKLSKAKLSDGNQPSAAKWSSGALPSSVLRADLKRMFEGWDITH